MSSLCISILSAFQIYDLQIFPPRDDQQSYVYRRMIRFVCISVQVPGSWDWSLIAAWHSAGSLSRLSEEYSVICRKWDYSPAIGSF